MGEGVSKIVKIACVIYGRPLFKNKLMWYFTFRSKTSADWPTSHNAIYIGKQSAKTCQLVQKTFEIVCLSDI